MLVGFITLSQHYKYTTYILTSQIIDKNNRQIFIVLTLFNYNIICKYVLLFGVVVDMVLHHGKHTWFADAAE